MKKTLCAFLVILTLAALLPLFVSADESRIDGPVRLYTDRAPKAGDKIKNIRVTSTDGTVGYGRVNAHRFYTWHSLFFDYHCSRRYMLSPDMMSWQASDEDRAGGMLDALLTGLEKAVLIPENLGITIADLGFDK